MGPIDDGVNTGGSLGSECVCQTQPCVCKPADSPPGGLRACARVTGATCNPNTWEAEAGGLESSRKFSQSCGKFEVSQGKREIAERRRKEHTSSTRLRLCAPDDTVGLTQMLLWERAAETGLGVSLAMNEQVHPGPATPDDICSQSPEQASLVSKNKTSRLSLSLDAQLMHL